MHDSEIETLFELIREITEAISKPKNRRVPIGFKTQSTKNDNPEMKVKQNITAKPTTKKKK
jgi:uncharacterized protein YqgV (UPF0045/DUF77 family)